MQKPPLSISLFFCLFSLLCEAQIPYFQEFEYKDLKPHLLAYHSERRELTKALSVHIDSAESFYVRKVWLLSDILLHPPTYFSKVDSILLLVYDEKKGYLRASDFNKKNIREYNTYLQDDMWMDYAVAKKKKRDKNGKKIIVRDTLLFPHYIYKLSDMPYYKFTKINGGYYVTLEFECPVVERLWKIPKYGVSNLAPYYITKKRRKYPTKWRKF